MAHRLDPATSYCIRCGIGAEQIGNPQRYECYSDPGSLRLHRCVDEGSSVVGISHLIEARRRQPELDLFGT